MKTVKSYVKQVLAQLTGDQSTVVAERNYRMGRAGLKGQISALETQEIKQETKVAEEEENLLKAKYPTTAISNVQAYVDNIQYRQNVLDEAKKALSDTKHSIEYFNNLLQEFDQDEPVAEAA